MDLPIYSCCTWPFFKFTCYNDVSASLVSQGSAPLPTSLAIFPACPWCHVCFFDICDLGLCPVSGLVWGCLVLLRGDRGLLPECALPEEYLSHKTVSPRKHASPQAFCQWIVSIRRLALIFVGNGLEQSVGSYVINRVLTACLVQWLCCVFKTQERIKQRKYTRF